MFMLSAILLSVAPGVGPHPDAVAAIGLTAVVLYAVEALGDLYDLATAVAQEVRA